MKTTLNKVRAHFPYKTTYSDVLGKLRRDLGDTKDDSELSLLTILDSIGLDWAIWSLRTVDGHDKEIRLFAIWCARKVQHLMTDKRSINALDVAEKYALGTATQDELTVAFAGAKEASWIADRDAMAASVQTNAKHPAVRAVAKKDDSIRAAWDSTHELRHSAALRATAYAATAAENAAKTVVMGFKAGVYDFIDAASEAVYEAANAAAKAANHAAATDGVGTDISIWRACQAAEDKARLAQEKELCRICINCDAHG